jgi:hypothetical protein
VYASRLVLSTGQRTLPAAWVERNPSRRQGCRWLLMEHDFEVLGFPTSNPRYFELQRWQVCFVIPAVGTSPPSSIRFALFEDLACPFTAKKCLSSQPASATTLIQESSHPRWSMFEDFIKGGRLHCTSPGYLAFSRFIVIGAPCCLRVRDSAACLAFWA